MIIINNNPEIKNLDKQVREISKNILPEWGELIDTVEIIWDEFYTLLGETDGWLIYISPAIVEQYGLYFAVFVFLHELIHILHRDPQTERERGLNGELWNYATDIANDYFLFTICEKRNIPIDEKYREITENFWKQISEILGEDIEKITNYSAVEIYEKLVEKLKPYPSDPRPVSWDIDEYRVKINSIVSKISQKEVMWYDCG